MTYVPDRGHVVWLQFNPQAGHEQAGHRPALVVSPAAYNGRTGLALCCPVTSQVKGYPFEVPLGDNPVVTGVVLADQVKNFDWRAKGVRFAAAADSAVVEEVVAKLAALLRLE